MNQHVIEFINYIGARCNNDYITGEMNYDTYIMKLEQYNEALALEVRLVVGNALGVKEDCIDWNPMFDGKLRIEE